MLDIVVKNAKVFHDGELKELEISVRDGKIYKLSKIAPPEQADVVVDVGGRIVLPGVIDAHVHFRDPGFTSKENWYTGSCAAAGGGVTCVVDHPNTNPPTIDPKAFRKKLRRANKLSIVDFGINGGVTSNLEMLERLKECGITAFGEIFMAPSTNAEPLDNTILRKALEKISELSLPACIHAEDGEIILKAESRFDPTNPMYHCLMRPPEAEVEAVVKVVNMVKDLDVKLHICHISTEDGAGMVRNAKYVGMKVSCEVTPHHLLLSEDDMLRLGGMGKMNPPLRPYTHVQKLWEYLRRGIIDIIVSDHAPHRRIEKDNVFDSPPGVPGVETMFPLMLACVKRNMIPLERVVNASSERVADIFGILGKGKIEGGYDADFGVYDMKCVGKVEGEKLHSKAGWSPFDGFDAIFPSLVIRRGEIIYDEREEGGIVAEKGSGRWIGE
jgi:dihydroorotase